MLLKEAELRYGRKMLKRMEKYLTGITVSVLPNGEFDTPKRDYERAYELAVSSRSKVF